MAVEKKKQSVKKADPILKQKADMYKKVVEYKVGSEAAVVSLLYKTPDLIHETNLEINDFHTNAWRVYFEILRIMIVEEKKSAVSDVEVGLCLEKHPKLADEYNKNGGYDTIVSAAEYILAENFDSYITDLRKWNSVLKMIKRGFPVNDELLSRIADMNAEDLYNEYSIYLNDIFANVDNNIKSYNGFEGMRKLVDEMDAGMGVGIPLTGFDIINKEIGGLLAGNIYGIGARSGLGKSAITINAIFPTMIKENLKAVYIINEENVTRFQKEALIYYATNVLKKPIPKHVLRDGKFTDEVRETLYKAADWFESQKDNRNITIIPLEEYTSAVVVKLIKKYSKMGADVIVLDTLKESADSVSDLAWKTIMRDCVKFYDAIKHTETAMVITYQLTKTKNKYLTSADIGVAKNIEDVFSVSLLMTRPLQSQYEGEREELYCWRNEGQNGKSKVPFTLKRDKHYMITFINKNRFGQTGIQIVSEFDLSINNFKDIGYCSVVQDY